MSEKTVMKSDKVKLAKVKEKITELQNGFMSQMEQKQASNAGSGAATYGMQAEIQMYIGLAKYMTELFFTRDNYCYTNYLTQKEKKKGEYYITKFNGIMIHSPASCNTGFKTRDIFNRYSKKDSKIGTHFVVDGDSGYIYALLPLDCKANHCGQPMQSSSKAVSGTKSLNSQLIAIDFGEPSGVLCISGEQGANFESKEYRNKYFKKMGSKYYGIAERISSGAYEKLPKEERSEWHLAKKSSGTKEYFRSSDDFVKKTRENVARAYHATAELAAALCYVYGFEPLHKGKKLGFNKEKKVYYETDTDVYDVIIGHIEGYENFYKASLHGDPENMWEMEGNGYTMDTFRQEVNKELKKLINKEVKLHPMLACLSKRWKGAWV
ncbi:MAG: N-acetylmuramoyl-L-alanine amidase [Lachnospiraceae bacterium]|nr:N-acetylmuramoyl-L-alanine amidase [Lachnospiraceae bacterium]